LPYYFSNRDGQQYTEKPEQPADIYRLNPISPTRWLQRNTEDSSVKYETNNQEPLSVNSNTFKHWQTGFNIKLFYRRITEKDKSERYIRVSRYRWEHRKTWTLTLKGKQVLGKN